MADFSIPEPSAHIHRGPAEEIALSLYRLIHALERCDISKTVTHHNDEESLVYIIPTLMGGFISFERLPFNAIETSYTEDGLRIETTQARLEIPPTHWIEEFKPNNEDHIIAFAGYLFNLIESMVHENDTERAERDPRLKDTIEAAENWVALETMNGPLNLCIRGPSDYESGNVWVSGQGQIFDAPDHICDIAMRSVRICSSIQFRGGTVRVDSQYRASIPKRGFLNDPVGYMAYIAKPPPRMHYLSDARWTSRFEVLPPIRRPGDKPNAKRR